MIWGGCPTARVWSSRRGRAIACLRVDQMSCCFGQAPEANGWVVVTATNGVEVMMDRIIRVTGVLTVEERWDEEFFVGLYHMDCKDITGPAL